MMSDIKIIPSKNIDRQKWDACVERNDNGLIYARSFYLDTMSENWSAIIAGDYEVIMPLTWRSMFGIKYLSKETFIQQLGIIGTAEESVIKKIIGIALKGYNLYGRLSFNFSNNISYLHNIKPKINFIIDLQQPYSDIFKSYTESLQRNVRRAIKNGVTIMPASNTEAAHAYRDYLFTFMDIKQVKNIFKRVDKLIQDKAAGKFILSKKAIDENGNTLAICLWLKDNKRIYNVMPTTLSSGKDKVAMPLLLNNIIEEHCEQKMYFDFEGSELPGIKKFYEKFSPVNQPYFLYEYNNLRWPLKLLKK
ncbi:MAG: peptidoglycan bridge formation glycyltransferase FemA/FemB family protein [Arachidicoccus sp.]|nr:peptidoglycan bridge formation glycyltransferase FemA/FemB family protein [Arachidicoccus sp.]